MSNTLYWMALSHPSLAARKMLDLKGVEYDLAVLQPFSQRVQLRLAGFAGGTVPALKLDGHRVQGSRAIAMALDERWPTPPLFPADPALRARVLEAERWGDEEFQPLPRRLFRWGMAENADLRRWALRAQRIPMASLAAVAMIPLVRHYARVIEADGRRATTTAAVRADLAALPAMLDRVDRLLDDGTLSLDPPNAATLQALATVQALDAFDDLRELVRARRCAETARGLYGDYPMRCPPFLDPAWLEPAQDIAA